MKSVVLFLIILVIGFFGGIVAGEIKTIFMDEVVPNVNDNSSILVAEFDSIKDKFNKKVRVIEDKLKNEYDAELKDLRAEIAKANEKPVIDPNDIVSDDENIQKLQSQINELRGLVKANQQNVGETVVEEIKKNQEEEQAQRDAERAERMKTWQDEQKKRQDETYKEHTEKMKKELNLSSNQVTSVQAAFVARGEKLSELYSEIGRGNFTDIRAKRDEITKEWEESVKSVLSSTQYDDFVKKNLNEVSGGGRGGFNRPRR
ncbi:MAG: hypothetical protein K8S87_08145 [Planctomycetes bacterium]|nr:hypothetical protein [Planctomycetota bacterium]